jgi:hypothetical protein
LAVFSVMPRTGIAPQRLDAGRDRVRARHVPGGSGQLVGRHADEPPLRVFPRQSVKHSDGSGITPPADNLHAAQFHVPVAEDELAATERRQASRWLLRAFVGAGRCRLQGLLNDLPRGPTLPPSGLGRKSVAPYERNWLIRLNTSAGSAAMMIPSPKSNSAPSAARSVDAERVGSGESSIAAR